MPKNWAKLSSAERIHRCRVMAHEARKLAESAAPPLKKSYMSIAGEWEVLAADIELHR